MRDTARLLARQTAGVGGEIQQGDRICAAVSRNAGTGRGVFTQRIVNTDFALLRHFYQHFTGNKFGQRGDTHHRVFTRSQIGTGTGFPEAAENLLIVINDNQRHSHRAAAVKDVFCMVIHDLRRQTRILLRVAP
ncbi:hypothetical protein SRABI106_00161 [Rahnella aquatilis]|nr:hypothetical protein SRABI106_00161 [Rahnella aquatilis]